MRLQVRQGLVAVAAAGLVATWSVPTAAVPVTTVVRTIRDVDGDNLLEFAPGEDYVVLGTEDDDFRPPADGSILNFLQMSDFQMVDEESPARVEFLDRTQRGPFTPFSAAYRPQESLTTQIAEAMVRAARNTVSPVTHERLDMTILTGDNADSQQYNETRWFIDILDGQKKVDPNSGIPTPLCESTPGTIYDGVRGNNEYYEPDASGPQTDGDGYSPNRVENRIRTAPDFDGDVTMRDFPGLFEDANRPFQAIGLDMPWFTAFGNHDALVQGNSSDAYVGPTGPGHSPVPPASEVQNPSYQEIATGCFKASNAASLNPPPNDPNSFLGVLLDAGSTVEVPPDPRRCFLAKDQPVTGPPGTPCQNSSWVDEHSVTTGQPVGHGFVPGACELEAPNDQYEVCNL